jgi:tetratricopeptide (TPR) repeat protein
MAEAWLARGSAYFLLGQNQKAMDDLVEALRLKPDYAEASTVLAKAQETFVRQEVGKNAVPPRAPPGSVTRVPEASRGEGQRETLPAPPPALPSREPAVAPVPVKETPPVKEPAPAKESAVVKTRAKKNVEPKPVSNKSTEPPPPKVAADKPSAPGKSPAALNQQGRELIQEKKYAEAIEALSEAIRLQPDFALALNARGFAYQLTHDYKHAIADFDAAIRINPKYTNAYQNRRNARQASGDKAGAAEDAAKLKELAK